MQPPMTPMIDCTFNLLIFFLLTPSFATNEGYLTTNLPRQGGCPGPEPPALRIKVELEAAGPGAEGVVIRLNETQSLGDNFGALAAALEAMRKQGLAAEFPVLIAPGSGVRHKWVVKAFDAAVASRYTNIQFAVPR
jgi:biopolymer transport protein ExbD